jgi:hypothetical protein
MMPNLTIRFSLTDDEGRSWTAQPAVHLPAPGRPEATIGYARQIIADLTEIRSMRLISVEFTGSDGESRELFDIPPTPNDNTF